MSSVAVIDRLTNGEASDYTINATVRLGIEKLHTQFFITAGEGQIIQDTLDDENIVQDKLL